MRSARQLIILIICVLNQVALAEDLGFLDFDYDFIELYRTTLGVSSMTFEEEDDVLHVFYTESRPEGEALMYFTHKSGVSDFPQELLFESGGFFDLHSRMVSSDAVHLVWPENQRESNPSGKIHYARFNLISHSIDQHQIVFTQDTGRLPDIEVESDGDVHISFEFWESDQSGVSYYLGYARQVDGEFQPLETASFADNQSRGSYPEMCIDPDGNAYFIGAGQEHPMLLIFRNGQFGSPVQVTDFYNYYRLDSTRDRRRILYGDEGRVHLFLTVSIAKESDTSTTRIVHVETSDGISFSEPEFVTSAHTAFRFVSEPAIMSDGTKILCYFNTSTLRPYFSLN